jgi:hypothetical protein
MTKYFHSNPIAFYDSEINQIPQNSVEITEEKWQELLSGQSIGKVIVADSNGRPILQDAPAPTQEQLDAQQAQVNAKASALANLTALGLTQAEITALIG